MPKVSISLPEELLRFVDRQGTNRSRTIAQILTLYRQEKRQEKLTQDYDAYQELAEPLDEEWEAASMHDIAHDL